MNKLEADYANLLNTNKKIGLNHGFLFEQIKLRLADKTFYTPDFMVIGKGGEIEMHEVKGFMRDDAAVKLKVAAEQFPFRFILAKKVKGKWQIKEI